MASRPGAVLVGPPGGGKTVVRELLAQATQAMRTGPDTLQVHVVLPSALGPGELMGCYGTTMQWCDGILAQILRRDAEKARLEGAQGPRAEEPEASWVVLDGPLEASWIEDLNSVLDNTRRLCLASGKGRQPGGQGGACSRGHAAGGMQQGAHAGGYCGLLAGCM